MRWRKDPDADILTFSNSKSQTSKQIKKTKGKKLPCSMNYNYLTPVLYCEILFITTNLDTKTISA